MRTSAIVTVAGAAVLLFWVIGANNRLVALRNAIGSAWDKVQDALTQRASGVATLDSLLREPLAAEQGALDTWLAAHAEAAKAAAADYFKKRSTKATPRPSTWERLSVASGQPWP